MPTSLTDLVALKIATRSDDLEAFVKWIKIQAEKTDPDDFEANTKLLRQVYNRACQLER